MVADHIGAVFFPDILAIRFLGRLSFPLFAWLIGQGEKHTRNLRLYLGRLIILGGVSQPIFYLVFRYFALNILATLSLGLLAIKLNKLTRVKLLFPFIFAALAQYTNCEYGAYGVFVIFLLSEFNYARIFWWIKWLALHSLIFFLPGLPSYQFLAGLAPIILILWKREQGQKAKWFYLFYPLHLALILLVQWLILSR
jgi:hypothetical protein